MKTSPLLLCAVLLSSQFLGFGAAVTNREAAVRADRATMENDARWIYNDLARGMTEARWKGKPLLVALRCVPCLSCAGLDTSVLRDDSLAPLLDKFVCVRVINANALDLSLFQFDYDLSFSTLFLNADGTVYGRFGSWTHQKNPAEKSLASYRAALEAALALHRQYPENKSALAGKQGAPMPFQSPVEIPALAAKYKRDLDWQGKVVQSCVHCHQIGEALRTYHRAQKTPVPKELIYPMPAPETIGLEMAVEQRATVARVVENSAAARAGFRAGDEIVSLAGQPPVSVADLSWALHRAPETGRLPARVRRGATETALEISLPAGWRERADISRRVGTWQMRAMTSGGLVLEDLPDETRTARGLKPDQLALRVKSVGQYGQHAAAKNAGFKKDDVIVEFGGRTARATESELIGAVLQKHPLGEKVPVTVLRGSQRVALHMPMQ